MNQPGIYQIQSKIIPKRIYIGSAINISNRKQKHISELKLNKHKNNRLQNHVNKYGIDDLIFSIIEPCMFEFLTSREQFYIDKFNPYFNICKIAGNTLGLKFSQEAKDKISIAKKGKPGHKLSPEVIINLKKILTGRIVSDETREKLSKSRKGKGYGFKKGYKPSVERNLKQSITMKNRYPHGVHTSEMSKAIGLKNRGKKLSEEHKQKLIECNKNRVYTEEERKRMSERTKGNKYCVGRKLNEESRLKNRISHLGKIASSETRKKLSFIHKGKPFSEEHKKKLSISIKQSLLKKKERESQNLKIA